MLRLYYRTHQQADTTGGHSTEENLLTIQDLRNIFVDTEDMVADGDSGAVQEGHPILGEGDAEDQAASRSSDDVQNELDLMGVSQSIEENKAVEENEEVEEVEQAHSSGEVVADSQVSEPSTSGSSGNINETLQQKEEEEAQNEEVFTFV